MQAQVDPRDLARVLKRLDKLQGATLRSAPSRPSRRA